MPRRARPDERGHEAARPIDTGVRRDQGSAPELLRDAQRVAVDLLVFAPIGLAKRARSLLPDLIREGRSTAASARTIGRFVTPIARKQGTKLVKSKVEGLSRTISDASVPRPALSASAASAPSRTSAASAPSRSSASRRGPAARAPKTAAMHPATSKTASLPPEPFPGYDHLGSAAVVARLAELSRAERGAVRSYERSNRNRRTVLGRLEQLDS